MDWRHWRERLIGSAADGGLTRSRSRIRAAYAVAIVTDVLQLSLGPFGWAFFDEILDVGAMLIMTRLLGFHPLLLPTFVLELVPVMDMLPTWTGCVALVVATRRTESPRESGGTGEQPVTIDVKPTNVK
jgi:hypothetical protein